MPSLAQQSPREKRWQASLVLTINRVENGCLAKRLLVLSRRITPVVTVLMAANAVFRIGLIWLSRERDQMLRQQEGKKRTRLFQSKVFEASGVNALEVALVVGVWARARWGPAASARDTKNTEGDMGITREKKTDDLGGGKGQRTDRWLVEVVHGFYA